MKNSGRAAEHLISRTFRLLSTAFSSFRAALAAERRAPPFSRAAPREAISRVSRCRRRAL